MSIKIHRSLRERCFGDLEGCTLEEIPTELEEKFVQAKSLPMKEYMHFKSTEKHESYAELHARLNPFLFEIHQKHPDEHVLLVTHNGVLKTIIMANNLMPGRDWYLDNCAYITVSINASGMKLLHSSGISAR